MPIIAKKTDAKKTTAECCTCPKCNLYRSTIAAIAAHKKIMRQCEPHQQNEKNEQESSDESELESSDESENEDDLINIGIPENIFNRIDLMYRQ